MRDAGFGEGHPVPYLGTFGEINVRLYSTDAQRTPRAWCSARWRPSASPCVLATDPIGVALPVGPDP